MVSKRFPNIGYPFRCAGLISAVQPWDLFGMIATLMPCGQPEDSLIRS